MYCCFWHTITPEMPLLTLTNNQQKIRIFTSVFQVFFENSQRKHKRKTSGKLGHVLEFSYFYFLIKSKKNARKIICKWVISWITQRYIDKIRPSKFSLWKISQKTKKEREGGRQTNRYIFCFVLSVFRYNIFCLLSNNLLRFIKHSHIFISFRMSVCVCVFACTRTIYKTQNGSRFRSNPFLHVQNIKVLKYYFVYERQYCCCWWCFFCLMWPLFSFIHFFFLLFFFFLCFFHNSVLFSSQFTFVMAFYCLNAKFSIEKFTLFVKTMTTTTHIMGECAKYSCMCVYFAFSPNGIQSEWIMETE